MSWPTVRLYTYAIASTSISFLSRGNAHRHRNIKRWRSIHAHSSIEYRSLSFLCAFYFITPFHKRSKMKWKNIRMWTVSLLFLWTASSKNCFNLLRTHAVCYRQWEDNRCAITPLFVSLLCMWCCCTNEDDIIETEAYMSWSGNVPNRHFSAW